MNPLPKTERSYAIALLLWRLVRHLTPRRRKQSLVGKHVFARRWSEFGCGTFSGVVTEHGERTSVIRVDKQFSNLPVDVTVWSDDILPLPNK